MIPAAAALWSSITEPEFLVIWLPIAVVAALFIWAERHADRLRADARRREALASFSDEWTCAIVTAARSAA